MANNKLIMTKERALQKAKLYREWAEKRTVKGKSMEDAHFKWTHAFDFTEPIKIGHHSEKKHRAIMEKRDNEMRSIIENDKIIKRMLEKAENLERFANTNKGDAERKREEQRAKVDTLFKVGSNVYDFCFREGVIMKVNKKTFTIKFASGSTFTRDKSYFI